ncbi:Zn-ribbon domain-containing OB-fold protein [Chloroflexota bacterium]
MEIEYKLTFNEYSEALKENKILGLKCGDCGFVTTPPKMVCRKCTGSNLEIVELKSTGKIKTFTTNNVAPEGRESEAPYVIVMVELDEGPWIMGGITGMDPAAATMENMIDKKVKMEKAEVFAGDKYSAGEGAWPIFGLS